MAGELLIAYYFALKIVRGKIAMKQSMIGGVIFFKVTHRLFLAAPWDVA